jgi:phytanoyl-CoA hydroxylase
MTTARTNVGLEWIREEYDANGYVVVRNVLDPCLLREMSQHLDWLTAHNPGVRPERLGHTLIPDDPFWCRVVSDSRLLDIAEQFVGPNIALFASSYFAKPPFDGLPVLWHQDGSYWPLDPPDAVVSLWVAVDDSTPENGCLRVIPGSHRMELKGLITETAIPNALQSRMPPEWIDESKAVDVILNAGDVSVHSPNMIHGSNANNSPKRRCGLSIRYIPTSTRIVRNMPGPRGARATSDALWPDGRWSCCFLLRGEAIAGINDYVPMPRFDRARHMPFEGCDTWK